MTQVAIHRQTRGAHPPLTRPAAAARRWRGARGRVDRRDMLAARPLTALHQATIQRVRDERRPGAASGRPHAHVRPEPA
ncbi:MAG: hypothetical protein ACK52I_00010 [Pseudomonadota bacterium]